MNGWVIAEAGHVINVIPPVDGNAGAPVTAQGFSMRGYNHATIIVQLGVTAAAPTSIILKAAPTLAGSQTAIGFRAAAQTGSGASQDVLGALTAYASTGITAVTSNSKTFYVIEIDASELPDGSPWLFLALTNPASSVLCSAVAILSHGRYQLQSSSTQTS